jgi:hypothetical protein
VLACPLVGDPAALESDDVEKDDAYEDGGDIEDHRPSSKVPAPALAFFVEDVTGAAF